MKKTSKCFNIAIVVSKFNQDITDKLYNSAIQRLQEYDFEGQNIKTIFVPGAVEIPIAAQRLAITKKYDAIVTLGSVVMGETKHFDYVCEQASNGCQQVALQYNIPVIFGVLTTNNQEQAYARAGGKKCNVGRSSIDTAIELLESLEQI